MEEQNEPLIDEVWARKYNNHNIWQGLQFKLKNYSRELSRWSVHQRRDSTREIEEKENLYIIHKRQEWKYSS